jgi:hypothetical protein
MSFHIEITANDEPRTVVYSEDVDDFDLTGTGVGGKPLNIKVGQTAAFSGEGNLDAEVTNAEKPKKSRRGWWGR